MRLITLLTFCIALLPNSGAAQRQYRCNGRVQYYPCGQELFKPPPLRYGAARVSPPPAPRAQFRGDSSDGLKYAEVTAKTYQRSGAQGWWRGTVKGNGRVHLQLDILRNGSLESTRYMGNVELKDKSTWFSFKSPLPKGSGWSWDIHAFSS